MENQDTTEECIDALVERYSHLTKDHIREALAQAKKMNQAITRGVVLGGRVYQVTKLSMGPLDTAYGLLHQMNFHVDDRWENYNGVVKAPIDQETMLPIFEEGKPLYIRLDSGCEPGQRFYDRTCDCRKQFVIALKDLQQYDHGLILHMPTQDGRGRGTGHHLATLYLQKELGIHTVESFWLFGGDNAPESIDARTYDGAVAILGFLGIQNQEITYGTNNPNKMLPLDNFGFRIERRPVIAPLTDKLRPHLIAKRDVLGHLFDEALGTYKKVDTGEYK